MDFNFHLHQTLVKINQHAYYQLTSVLHFGCWHREILTLFKVREVLFHKINNLSTQTAEPEPIVLKRSPVKLNHCLQDTTKT